MLTAGGSLDPAHPILAEGALVLTTAGAAAELRAAVPPATEVVAVNEGDRVDPALAVAELRARGHAVILSEAGPTVFAQLLAARLVDELFLTLSPLVAGRGAGRRLGLAEGVELLPGTRVEPALLSLRRSGSHLFLRYGIVYARPRPARLRSHSVSGSGAPMRCASRARKSAALIEADQSPGPLGSIEFAALGQ